MQLFISSYSLQMQGGYFRFQAQYLRRLRVPKWEFVRLAMRKRLAEAARSGDAKACDYASAELFGLDDAELALLESISKPHFWTSRSGAGEKQTASEDADRGERVLPQSFQ